MKSQIKSRVAHLDTMRTLSMLWVVSILHMCSSLQGMPVLTSKFSNCITITSLGSFTFLSGFFLANKVRSKQDIKAFYKARLLRFYPLYFLSCVSMLCAQLLSHSSSMMTVRQFAFSIVGLGTIFGPSTITLWYFSMLMVFYAITPLFSMEYDTRKKVIVFILSYLLLFASTKWFSGDERMLMYYPVYVASVFAGKKYRNYFLTSTINVKQTLFAVLSFALACVLYQVIEQHTATIFVGIIVAFCGAWLLFHLCRLISCSWVEKISLVMSYASLVVYLFHSQMFWVCELIFGKFTLPIAYGVVLPLLFGGSWLVQKIYDSLLRRVKI